ncbi:hypothetical protein LRS10_21475 [Phenylobacterium sp. J426]|uniref:hypothetical protein n=1 Tax=Phenylobacterium sp. J426 TaxID=2898439 RepID=UPI002151C756|nr:hypothetical protein [Phenylobacterium sp. J426]MCR5876487.1 hypothetical protein [Phenylobacterium sp. J426]
MPVMHRRQAILMAAASAGLIALPPARASAQAPAQASGSVTPLVTEPISAFIAGGQKMAIDAETLDLGSRHPRHPGLHRRLP